MKIYTKQSKSPRRSAVLSSASVRGMLWEAVLKRKIMLFSALVLVVTIPLLYLVYKYQSPIQAAWFDDTWGYRQTVAVTNAGTAQTDFQVAITLNTSSLISAGNPEERLLAPVFYVHASQERVYGARMQSDCDDIRITDLPRNQSEGMCYRGVNGKLSLNMLSLTFSRKFSWSLIENNPEKKKSDQNQSSGDQSISVNIPKINIFHIFPSSSSNLTVNSKNNIPARISTVKTKNDLAPATDKKLGAIAATPNHPADRFIDNPEKALSKGFEKNLVINSNLTDKSFLVNKA